MNPENPYAFPEGAGAGDSQRGMTLRDYFAAAALTGLSGGRVNVSEIEDYAEMSYRVADAMLQERAKRC